MSGIKSTVTDHIRGSEQSEMDSDFNRRTFSRRRWWNIPRRYQIAIMCYIAYAIRSWINTNLWVMFIHIFLMDAEERREHFPTSSNWTVEDFEANDDLNYWGSAMIQIPAAALTLRFSPLKIMLLSILSSSIIHMMLPFIINGPVAALGFITFLQGVTSGLFSCSCMGLWKEWAPVNERTSLLVLTFSGQLLSYYVTFYLSLYIAGTIGPFSIYYIAGICGLVWCLLWNTCIYETPASDPLITIEELCYLEEKVPSEGKQKIPLKLVPAKSIITSIPVMTLMLIFFTKSFLNKIMILSGMLLNTELPELQYDD